MVATFQQQNTKVKTPAKEHGQNGDILKQEMSLKKTNGVGLKKRKKVLVHKSFTDAGKLRMIIVKDQWQLFWRTLLESN